MAIVFPEHQLYYKTSTKLSHTFTSRQTTYSTKFKSPMISQEKAEFKILPLIHSIQCKAHH